MNLYLLNYNNYYNRRVKREQYLADYQPFLCQPNVMSYGGNPTEYHNFSPNDYVNTVAELNWLGDMPDYIVCSEDNETIDSRWFVIEAVRIRGGQYRFSLARDLVADFWDDLLSAPIFVEKGMLPITDSFIMNEEPGNFNQIRMSQKRLFDDTKTPWIIGYIPQDMFNEDDPQTRTLTIPARAAAPIDYDYTTARLESITGGYTRFFPSNQFRTEVVLTNTPNGQGAFTGRDFVQTYFNQESELESSVESVSFGTSYHLDTSETNIIGSNLTDELRRTVMGYVVRTRLSKNISYTDGLFNLRNSYGVYDDEKYNRFSDAVSGLNGKIIYNEETGVVYKINVKTYQSEYANGVYLNQLEPNEQINKIVSGYQAMLGTHYSEIIKIQGGEITATWAKNISGFNSATIKLFTGVGIELTFEELTSPVNVTFTFPKATDRIKCQDQPYDIFCVPYYEFSDSRGQYVTEEAVTGRIIKLNKGVVLNLMQRLPALVGSQAIYDIQIVPYCPLDTGRITKTGGTAGQDIILCGPSYGDTPIKQGEETIGWVSWLRKSSGTTEITTPGYEFPTDPMIAKVKGTTSFLRLAANNQSKFFDLNWIKNKGLAKVRVDYTYKPYSPFIKVTPVWNPGGLYATQSLVTDPRGLIIAGDMSIAQVTDKWADYELNNKNYLSIFDRQIQSMEFNRDWGMGLGGIAALGGVAAGALGGAAVGKMVGGAGAALVGGVAGGTGAALAGGGDVIIDLLKQNEAIDYTKDLFQYQLGNIKALPQGLAKTAAQTIIDSYVPTLEYWAATTTEENALENKIKYNGMTVQRIDYLYNFVPQGGYFKGQLIRLDGVKDDFHAINALAKEVLLGFYLPETGGDQ